jgi:ABC-type branched-subunit amino acid transport system substrate-binding protein
MAVDEQNQSATGSNRIRLVFRDIGADAAGAGQAVRSLADEGTGVILGALFSEQAREAAAAAEARRVVFVAPRATDDRVSRNRLYTFQANPTIEVRGRLLARFAVNGLLLRRFGILSGFDNQGISQSMAEAFQDEIERLGSEVVFFKTLQSASDWSRLPDMLDPDSLARTRALFVPLSGRQPERQANSLIQTLETLGADLRVLGNAEWHQLPLGPRADPYGVTYANDFRVDSSDRTTSAFLRSHRSRFGSDAGRLAHVGYDVTRFLLSTMSGHPTPADLADALRTAAAFEGTGMRIDFRGGQVNEAMFYQRYRDGRIDLLR